MLWRELGLPGLFDVHVHFMPEPMLRKVWAQFDAAGPLIGREWPIRYKGSDAERVGWLRERGVRHFSALSYAHKPEMAQWLNDWANDFARRTPECLHSATFYPEPGAADYVAQVLRDGAQIFKVHVQVGAFSVLDPLLDDVWGLLEDAATPIILHAGSGPIATSYTGPEPVAELLRRHPRLTLVMAHMGAPEYEAFLEMAERYERVHLDTTMVWTKFFDEHGRFPDALLPRLLDLEGKVLFGTDFPNIPYPYEHQIEVLAELGLGEDWLRGVLWHNASKLFTLE